MVKAENTIIGLVGHKGAGKTITAVMLLLQDYVINDCPRFFSNIYVELEGFQWLKGHDMIELTDKLNDSLIFIDELHEYADSRNSSSFQNKRVCDFFLQSRHTSSNIYYTTQYKDQIDKRIRRITDIDVVCQNLFIDSDKDGDDDMFSYTVVDRRRPGQLPYEDTYYGYPVFNIADTSQRVNPFVFTKKDEEKWKKEAF